jgi:hypothetical protein
VREKGSGCSVQALLQKSHAKREQSSLSVNGNPHWIESAPTFSLLYVGFQTSADIILSPKMIVSLPMQLTELGKQMCIVEDLQNHYLFFVTRELIFQIDVPYMTYLEIVIK